MYFFSIYIPAYKNVIFLSRLLDSVAMQSFRDFELIITDDSPDQEVESLVLQFQQKNPHIEFQYCKNDPVLGMPQNWNYGLSLCKGEWIKIMHDDDWFSSKNSLQILHDKTVSASKFIVSSYQNFYENKSPQLIKLTNQQKLRIEKEPLALVSDNVIGPPSVVCVHSSIKEIYDERLKWRVDIDYYIRILKETKSFTYIEEPLINVGIGALQVTQEVKNIKEIELPESEILWGKYGMNSLRSIFVYDGWWRFVRNLDIQDNDKKKLTKKEWPEPILHIIRSQDKIPKSLLKVGFFSKMFMSLSFLTLRKPADA